FAEPPGRPGRERIDVWDGTLRPTVTASDGASVKLLPKGATSGFITNRGRVEFEQPYAAAPIVILIPSTSFDSRDRWATTPDDADKGTGTLPMPSPAQIVMRATAQVTASGFEAFCRLIARGTPVQRQTSFAAPTTLSAIGSSSGAATPSSGQVPSLDDTYTAVFDVIVTNDYPNETVDI